MALTRRQVTNYVFCQVHYHNGGTKDMYLRLSDLVRFTNKPYIMAVTIKLASKFSTVVTTFIHYSKRTEPEYTKLVLHYMINLKAS